MDALHLEVLDLEVGNRGLQFRVPVHQAAIAVDQALAVELDEDLAHRGGQAVIHGEPLARPVQRGAQPAQLARDGAAGLRFPLPHALDELLAAEFAAVDALVGEQALNHHLRGDAGVVGAGLPQHVAPLHALPADQRVLHGEGQRVAHMQAAGDVRRRDHDGVGLRVGPGFGRECAAPLPAFIEAGLDLSRVVGLVQHFVLLRPQANAAGGRR